MASLVHRKHNFPCSLCHGLNFSEITQSGIYETRTTVKICRDCGLVCLNPRWDSLGYDNYYSTSYYAGYHSETAATIKLDDRGRLIARELSRVCPLSEAILEIGAGFGNNLFALQEAGFTHLSAVEIDRAGVTCINSNISGMREVFCGSLDQYASARAYVQYDAIVISHVLEHFVEPDVALRKIRSLLRPEGKLLVLVPNVDLERGYMRQFTTPHTHYFSRNILRAILMASGFCIEKDIEVSADQIGMLASATAVVDQPRFDAEEYNRQLVRARKEWFRAFLVSLGRRSVEVILCESTLRNIHRKIRASMSWRPWR